MFGTLVRILFSVRGIKLPVENMRKRAEVQPDTPWPRMYRTDAQAVAGLQRITVPPDVSDYVI